MHTFNNALLTSEYPASLKYENTIPIFKKDDKTDKTYYRPIGVLRNLCKIDERFMQNQIYSKYQCEFRKGFNVQHWLMAMIERWRKSRDAGGHAGALLTDLLKHLTALNY